MISADTRARVAQEARNLNYVVNGLAQSMSGAGTKTLAFVTNAFLAEPFVRIAQSVDGVSRSHRTMLLTNSSHTDMADERESIELLARQRVSGVLLIGSRTASASYRAHIAVCRDILASVGASLVLCGVSRIPGLDEVPSVAYDQRGGVREATTALLQAGHRRIAFLGYDDRSTARERFLGYRDALQANGQYVDNRSALVGHSDNFKDTLAPAMDRLLRMAPDRRPTAIVCVTDFAAYCVYSIARRYGLRIPEDLSITGFDDLSSNEVLIPRLSSVAVPYEDIGRYSARLALGLPVDQGEHPVFPVAFHARESIAPPRAQIPPPQVPAAHATRHESDLPADLRSCRYSTGANGDQFTGPVDLRTTSSAGIITSLRLPRPMRTAVAPICAKGTCTVVRGTMRSPA